MSTACMLQRPSALLRTLLLPILILVSPGVVLFLPLLAPPGYVFYGDELFYPWSVRRWSDDVFTTWSNGPSTNYQWIIQGFVWPASSSILGDEVTSKLVWLILAILPGLSAFLAASVLASEWRIASTLGSRFFPILTGLTYELGFYNVGFAPLPSFSWIYIALPLLFAVFIKGLRTNSLSLAFIFAGTSLLGSVNPLWIFDFGLLSLPFIIHTFVSKSTNTSKLRTAWWLAITTLATIAFNSYWLLPTLGGYALGAGGFFQTYTTGNLISYEQLRAASRWSVLDVLLVGHSPYSFFYSYPRSWTLANLLLPALAFGATFTRFSKLPQVVLLQISALVGVFFAKGVNPPFGEAYLTIAQSLPYGAGALLRNVGVSGWNTLFAYGLLIPLTLFELGQRYNEFFFRARKIIRSSFIRALVPRTSVALMIGGALVVAPLAHGTATDMSVYTYPHFTPRGIPAQYFGFQAWLDSYGTTGKVMWIPTTGYYLWHGNDPLSAWPSVLSGKRAVHPPQFLNLSPFIPAEATTVQTNRLGRILSLTGTDYIIFHGDSIYPNRLVQRWLENQVDLHEVNRTFLAIPTPPAMAEPREKPGYQVAGIPLVLISNVSLDRYDETVLAMNYTIPQAIAHLSGSGVFWEGFGIALEVLPAGVQPEVSEISTNRLAEAFVSRQTLSSNVTGLAEFAVRIPETAMAREADIYALYYGGAFESLSPMYFVKRIPISPPVYRAEFVLYENVANTAPLFVTKQPVVMTGGFEELLLAAQLNELDLRDWAVYLDTESKSAHVAGNNEILVTNGSLPTGRYVGIQNVLILADPLNLLKDEIRRVVDENAAIPMTSPGYVVDRTLSHSGAKFLGRPARNIITLNYSIPREVLNESGTERFSEGFGLAFEVLPAGVQPPASQLHQSRIIETFWEEQHQTGNASGSVVFSINVPESYSGSTVDVYAWFYGGAFRALSPYYYVDRWIVNGAYNSSSYGFDIARGGTVRLVNATLPLTVSVPADGTYTVALKVEGIVEVSKDSSPQAGVRDGEWTTFGPFSLSVGEVNFAIESSGISFLGTVLLYRGSPSPGSTSQALGPPSAPATILSHEQLSATDWEIVVDASRPFFLALTEPYDPLWQATIGSKTIASEPLYGMINGFWVNSSGTVQLRLRYSLQKHLEAGLVVSLVSIVGAIIAVVQPILRGTRGRKFTA